MIESYDKDPQGNVHLLLRPYYAQSYRELCVGVYVAECRVVVKVTSAVVFLSCFPYYMNSADGTLRLLQCSVLLHFHYCVVMITKGCYSRGLSVKKSGA